MLVLPIQKMNSEYSNVAVPCERPMKSKSVQLTHALGHEIADKRIDILRRIGAVGSISEAARAAGVSYKAAWHALDTLSNLAGTPLVNRVVGGAGGGGAVLTAAGERVLAAADQLSEARAAVIARLEADSTAGSQQPRTAALTLQTSMRNQLPCTVKRLHSHGASVRVELALSDDVSLFARITRDSAQLLDLHAGKPVLALCKATAVAIAGKLRAKHDWNLLHGKVSRVSRVKAGGEIALRLSGDLHLVGFGQSGHGLKVGADAMASIAEPGVVIAVSG
jgi:molybdate transport system regulatory protein